METGGKRMLLNAIRNLNGLSFRKSPKDTYSSQEELKQVYTFLCTHACVTYVGIHVNTGNFMGGT